MGLTYANIELIRTADLMLLEDGYITADQVRSVQVRALVDSGADGSRMETNVVGPVDVRCEGRETTVRAMVMPGDDTEVLLGAMPIEGLDLVIDLNSQKLVPNPDFPDGPHMSLKFLR
jgi:hypothetical protein